MTIRKGFLSNEQYVRLRETSCLGELKAIFVCGYITGIHKGELTVIQWPQVDFSAGFITLERDETKNGDP